MIWRMVLLAIVSIVVAGCEGPPVAKAPAPPQAAHDVADAAVVRRPLPESPTPAPAAAPLSPAAPAIVVPPDALYVCVVDVAGVRRQTAIEFSPKVGELCAKHPEMGPCQYERNSCRRGGGRVFAANGTEITMATEAEYDRKVMRVRFKGG